MLQPIREDGSDANGTMRYGAASVCGCRPTMEDAFACVPVLTPGTSLFAVFDGHGGAEVAETCKNEIAGCFRRSEALSKGRVEDSIRDVIRELDSKEYRKTAGATALIALITETTVFVANVGDCIAVGSFRNGEVRQLSTVHHPQMPVESARINAAGGRVLRHKGEVWRVDGVLAVSRAIGDFEFKNNPNLPPEAQKVVSTPDIEVVPRSELEFIILACDGVWDNMSPVEAAKLVRKGACVDGVKKTISIVANGILKKCCGRTSWGRGDNETMIVVIF